MAFAFTAGKVAGFDRPKWVLKSVNFLVCELIDFPIPEILGSVFLNFDCF